LDGLDTQLTMQDPVALLRSRNMAWPRRENKQTRLTRHADNAGILVWFRAATARPGYLNVSISLFNRRGLGEAKIWSIAQVVCKVDPKAHITNQTVIFPPSVGLAGAAATRVESCLVVGAFDLFLTWHRSLWALFVPRQV
jgi:hypothetical protein